MEKGADSTLFQAIENEKRYREVDNWTIFPTMNDNELSRNEYLCDWREFVCGSQ
jgi:hypothetical protein